jgi:hypothetical protein
MCHTRTRGRPRRSALVAAGPETIGQPPISVPLSHHPKCLPPHILCKIHREGKTPFVLRSSQGTALPVWLLYSALCHRHRQVAAPCTGAARLGTPCPQAPAPVAHYGIFRASAVYPGREGTTFDPRLGPQSTRKCTSPSFPAPRSTFASPPAPTCGAPIAYHRRAPSAKSCRQGRNPSGEPFDPVDCKSVPPTHVLLPGSSLLHLVNGHRWD